MIEYSNVTDTSKEKAKVKVQESILLAIIGMYQQAVSRKSRFDH
jgi:hypothetical protein